MLTKRILTGIYSRVIAECKRNFGITAPVMQKVSDPIQQLFLDKLRDYKSKSKNDSFVDATPEIQSELKSELERVAKQFGGGKGVDMTKFPDFKFQEPTIDPISIEKSA